MVHKGVNPGAVYFLMFRPKESKEEEQEQKMFYMKGKWKPISQLPKNYELFIDKKNRLSARKKVK
jgi:hypothetical protein